MDVINAIQNYLTKMIGETEGMKCLLLDEFTTPIVSMAITQSFLLSNEVYLTDRIENTTREKVRLLKTIVFIRPIPSSISHLIDELRDPKYAEYKVYFSNILPKSSLERLAESDSMEVVKSVQEFFADYLVLNPYLYTVPSSNIYTDSPDSWTFDSLTRSGDALFALLLSFKKKPLIRYDANSQMAKKLSGEIYYRMTQEQQAGLFDFRKMDTPPILLILDRKNDPITPLLTPWTYQSMIHELLTIYNGRVDLSNVPGIRNELREIVLSADGDPFFKKAMYLNFGDLGMQIKEYVDQYQSRTNLNKNIESVADMKRFVEEYPEFRKLAGNVSKHVTLVSELSRMVDKYNLLDVSELEQSLACNDSHNNDLKSLKSMIQSTLPEEIKIKLVSLYALRYELHTGNALQSLIEQMLSLGISKKKLEFIEYLLLYAGAQNRQEELFASESIFSRARSGIKGLKGVENVYTQHTPHIYDTLTALIRNKLNEKTHPFLEGQSIRRDKAQDIIIYMIGGVTFDEEKVVNSLNEGNNGVRIVIGGTSVLNSTSFIEGLEEGVSRWPARTANGRLQQRVMR